MTMSLPVPCPHCGRPNDSLTATEGPTTRPDDGDCSLCVGCGLWAVFHVLAGGALVLERPTAAELAEIALNPDATRALAALTAAGLSS